MENSLRFKISLRLIWPKWNLHRNEFHYARKYVNADNEVISHRSEVSKRFEFTLTKMKFDRSEIFSKVSFTTPENMWTLIMKLSHIEVKFYTKVKCQTGLSSLWPERNLSEVKLNYHWSEFHYARKYVNADNEVISHRSEILHQSEISNRLEFTLTKVKFDRKEICTEVKSQTGLSSLRVSHVNMLLKAIICTLPQWNCHVNGTTF